MGGFPEKLLRKLVSHQGKFIQSISYLLWLRDAESSGRN